MKNLLLALAISLGIVACGDESVGGPDVIDLDTDRDVSDVDIENPDVDVVDDTDADTEVTEDVVDTDSDGSDVVACPDLDEDGVCDDDDNCIDVVNEDQADEDSDGVGDACETCETFEVELVRMGDESFARIEEEGVLCIPSEDCAANIILLPNAEGTVYMDANGTECALVCTLDGAQCLQ